MTKVYIAGPMRGLPEFNFPAFHAAASKLRVAGFVVFNPAEFNSIFASCGESTPTHDYVRRDTHVIINELKSPDDGIVLLPGWENSRGAYAERALAVWCNLRIWCLEDLIHDITDQP